MAAYDSYLLEVYKTVEKLDNKRVEETHGILRYTLQQKVKLYQGMANEAQQLDTKYAEAVTGPVCWEQFGKRGQLMRDCGVHTNSVKSGNICIQDFRAALPALAESVPISSMEERKKAAPAGTRLSCGEPWSVESVVDVETKAMIGWNKQTMVLTRFGYLHVYRRKETSWLLADPEASYTASCISSAVKKSKKGHTCKINFTPRSALSMKKNFTVRCATDEELNSFHSHLSKFDENVPAQDLSPFTYVLKLIISIVKGFFFTFMCQLLSVTTHLYCLNYTVRVG